MSASAETRLRVVDEVHGRYHRQELISWWDQERLATAHVLVIGAGALGNEIVKNLALLGIGSLLIVDPDTIEISNLARCVLYRASDDGAPKATVAASRAMELNPDVTAQGIHGDVRDAVGLGAFLDADVVVAGVDNREARLFVNGACWKTGTPWVDGAVEGLMGLMRVFLPPDSACYESTLSEADYEQLAHRRACTLLSRDEMEEGKVPTTATCASVIAGMQAQEAVKLLHTDRIPSDFAGSGFFFNGLTHDSHVVRYTARDDALSRDTYDLSRLEVVPAATTFAELLERAKRRLGGDAQLLLEREIVRELRCSACENAETVGLPVTALDPGAALCPTCGAERGIDLVHRVGAGQTELLTLTSSELGLPDADVVTGGSADGRRCFFRVESASPGSSGHD